ncbi:hypothetical protein [Janthinobacterium sp. MDT1-19]|uniref:hypothetical protein n=1 Tax=Janthinobacterium sp. MDT1-19 TaxID=1259339 RepID=UPI003F22C25B
MGTLSDRDFDLALTHFLKSHRGLDDSNIAAAKEFLVHPGKLQIVIAEEKSMSRQLVNKQCKRLYEAYCDLKETMTGGDHAADNHV